MTLPGPITGVIREPITIYDWQGNSETKPYFRFNLAQISLETIWGAWKAPPPPGPWNVPLGTFAKWVYGYKPPGLIYDQTPDFGNTPESRKRIDRLVFMLHTEPQNVDVHLLGALDSVLDPEHRWIRSHLPDDHPQAPGGDVVLYIQADELGIRDFQSWYSKRLKDYEIHQCDALRATLGKAVGHLESEFFERDRAREAMMPLLRQFNAGLTVIDLCFKFTETADKRAAMWPDYKRATSQHVVHQVDTAWSERARVFRSEWKRDLIGTCMNVMDSPHATDIIDKAALSVVEILRDGSAPHLAMLKAWDELTEDAKSELHDTLRSAFVLVLQSPKAKAKLLEGELAEVAIAAAEAAGACSEDNIESFRVRDAIEDHTPGVIGAPKPTPLGKFLAERFTKTNDLLKQGELAVEILALGSPYVVAMIKQQDDGSPAAVARAIAWAWKALVGSTKLSVTARQDFWSTVSKVVVWGDASKDDFTKQFDLFKHEKGGLRELYGKSTGILAAGTVLARVCLMHYAAEASRDDPASFEKKLSRLQSIAEFAKSAFELTQAADAPKTLLSWVQSGSGKAPKVSATIALGLVADGLGFAIALERYGRSAHQSKAAQEQARLGLYLDSLSFAVSVAAAALGSSFVVAGLALYAAKTMLLDLDSWLPSVPFLDLKKKAGPHRYLEQMLRVLIDTGVETAEGDKRETTSLHNILASVRRHGGEALRKPIHDLHAQLVAAPMESSTLLWNFGGPSMGKSMIYRQTREFLQDQYSFSKSAAKIIVVAE